MSIHMRLAVCVFVAGLAACKGGGSGGSGGASGGSAGAQGNADEQLQEKLQPVIKSCVNDASPRAAQAMKRYYSWVDVKTGPTGKERNVYGTYTLTSNPQDCVEAAKKSASMKPALPSLEKAASEYAAALSALGPVLQETETYYQREKYKDDGFAGAKAIHPRLVAAFDAFEKTNAALHGELGSVTTALDQRLLERYEKEFGKSSYPYLVKKGSISAKKLATAADESGDKMTLAALEPLVNAQQADADELESLMKALGHAPNEAIGVYMGTLQNLAKVGREQVRRLRDKEANPGERRRTTRFASVHGDTPIEAAYNRSIEAYNQLQRDERYRGAFAKR